MAAIALKRGGSFSSSNASSDNPFRAGGNIGMKSGGGGGGGVSGMGLYGSSLTSLQYQPHNRENGGGSMYRRQSFSRDQSIGSGMGDDLSLVGECDLSSTRSDKHRPGRRASLSAAIELTREAPPKRNVSGSRPRGRRNSLFGNKNSHSDDPAATPIKLERSASGDNPSSSLMKKPKGRRASMAGYPAAGSSGGPNTTSVEPELTPQFFHSRKKGSKKEKDGRSVPDRKKSKSFDKTSKSMLSSLGKIKRPKGSGGSRRASMSGMPRKMGLSRGGSKNSDMSFMSGASSSFRSHNSNHSSSYDLSDDESQVSESIYLHRDKNNSKATSKHTVTEDDGLGYGDHTTYDPQLPPPPPPVPTKASKSKRAFQNRRGSTGAAVSGFKTTASAQKSLKESIMWKQQAATTTTTSIYQKKNPYSSHQQQKQQQSSLAPQDRRASAASSVANSVATDVASNVKSMQNSDATARRVPSDVPPSPRQRLGSTEYDSHDDEDDSNSDLDIKTFETPTQTEKAKVTASKGLLGATMAVIVDVDEVTPQQSNRKIKSRASMITNQNASALGGSSLGLMDDSLNSETSEDNDPLAPAAVSASTVAAGRRASRGLSMLQKPSSALNVSTHGSGGQLGFNLYGSSSRREEDEDNDDDGEDDNEDTIGEFHQKDHDKKQKNITPEAAEATAATTITTESTSDRSVDQRAEDSGNDKQTKDDDNTSASNVPSETQGDEKKPAVGIEGHNIDDHLEVIGATGDWSQGVGDDMLKPKSQGGDRNSLLDRYPGSEMDEMDLGYDPTHNTGNSEEEATMEHEYGNGYGPSDLYDEDYSSFGWREHRPRAADSIEYVNMEQLMSKAKNTKGLYLPTFVPAHGCSNASDFIVRCFVARLRAGMTVTKHSRSRFTKSHDRILHILPTGYHITWIPETEEEVVAKSKKSKQPTKLDLTKCLEVRHAWSRDPKSSKYTGTSTLRAKCKEGSANRSFALIYPHRTIDFTAATVDQCKILMEGFSALCFRLQMARLEQQSLDEDTQHTGMSAVEHDNDSTTASLTGTNMSSPWGL